MPKKTLDESQDQPAGQPSSRARRLRNEEWEAYRPTIEKLYREQGSSRSTVIEKLKQDGFTVTEKQFKHILKKWSIKKNISRTDLGIMLATKRRRDDDGKATQFAYHGHAVGEEKLQRAAKRLKTPAPFSTDMPSYIETFSPNPSNGSPLLGQATALAGFENPINEHSPSGLSHASILWDSPFQSSSHFTPVQQGFAFDPNDTDLGLAPFEIGEEASWNTQSTDPALSGDVSLHYSSDFSPSILNSNGFAGSFWADPPANNYDSMVDTSQNLFVSPVPRTSNNLASRTVLSTPVPNSIIASPPIATRTLGEPFSGLDDFQSSLDHSLEEITPSNKILFYGKNPENIIPSVQMMKTLVRRCQDEPFQHSHLPSRGPFQRKLVDEIQSETLRSEIDDVAFWAYQASAKFIRQQRTALRVADAEVVVSPGHYEDQDPMSQIQSGSSLNNTKYLKLAGTLASYSNIKTHGTTGGTFQIQLRQTPKKTSDDENDIPYYIVLSAIPEVRIRTEAGVCVTFPRKAQVLPIYTTIRTFNVVPEDSEIIKCVRMNDLEGVRKLMRENKASPRDVDPSGTSLLYYAVFSGCSDIFRLLVEGGANTDQCRLYGHLVSLIDCVWEHHVDFAIASICYPLGVPTKLISDIDQCRSMTEIALANGCLAEDSVPYNGDEPTPLFRVSRVVKQESTARHFANIVKQLLAAGYDKEFRNSRGETPLLYAAFSPGRRSLTALKLLLAEETDIRAVDNNGRDALHLCLCLTENLYNMYLDVCRGSIWARREQSIDENIAVTEASSDRNREEDAYHDDDSGDQESDVSFAGCEDNNSFSTPDNAVQSRKCCWCDDLDDIGWEERSFYYCEARDIDDFKMPSDTLGDHDYPDIEPEPWMCKARLRLKLFVLLQAGCDPNARDNFGGASPSDYARREGLWPQWEWALAESGWKYNEEMDLCEAKDVIS